MSGKAAGAVPDVQSVMCPRGRMLDLPNMIRENHRLHPHVDRVALGVEIYVWRCDWCGEEWAALDTQIRERLAADRAKGAKR